MVDFIKQDMTDIWASSGDVTAPDSAKIATGWVVEAVPRQWWNWFENRQDTNIAYMLQKGIPEWDIVTEYQTNKSYIQRNNVVYKCILGNAGLDPATNPTNWIKAFPESSASLEAIRTLTPAADQTPYFTGANTAALMTVTAFARTLLDDPNVTTMRATLGAQATHPNLTALSGAASPATNTLAYFNSATTMIVTPFTAFGRSLIDDADAAAARTTLEVDSAATVAANLAAGLATKQPLDTTLTALAGTATASNTINYWTGVDTTTTTPLTVFARTLLDDADAVTMRGTLSVYSIAENDAALTAGLATKQDLDATLTALAGLATGVNQLAYATGTDTFAQTTLTAFARSILDDADAVTVRGTIGADDAANLTTGVLDLARLPAALTGKNASTATALQTPRTIQGVAFDGTANITLSVVDKDSATGSAALPAGTSAQRTATPANGMLRYNNETNEFEGYQNGAWAGIGGGTPLYTVLWWPNRASIPAGYIPADGQLLTRTTYQAAFAGVNSGILPVVSDATWLATSTSRGCYTTGDGSTNFRIPDLNGKTVGTVAAPFLRGDGTLSNGTAGTFQQDALQTHTHNINLKTGSTGGSTFFGQANYGNGDGSQYGTNDIIAGRTATETRPTNVTGVFVIKLIGGASELSQDDASVAVAALEQKYLYTGGRNRIINGDARILQRTGAFVASNNTSGYGTVDRFFATNSGAGGQYTLAQGTIADGSVTKSAVKATVNTAISTTTGTSVWSGISQTIEGFNCFDLIGKAVTVSFLFQSNVTGTFNFALRDGSSANSFVTQFSATANVPTKITILIPAIPNGASIPQSISAGLIMWIGALNTATYQTATTGAWVSGNFVTAAGATNWGSTATNYISITDVQLEAGTSATEFERLNFTTQLALCQRYYEANTNMFFQDFPQTRHFHGRPSNFAVTKRAAPSLSVISQNGLSNIFTYQFGSSITTSGYQVLWQNDAAGSAAGWLSVAASCEL